MGTEIEQEENSNCIEKTGIADNDLNNLIDPVLNNSLTEIKSLIASLIDYEDVVAVKLDEKLNELIRKMDVLQLEINTMKNQNESVSIAMSGIDSKLSQISNQLDNIRYKL